MVSDRHPDQAIYLDPEPPATRSGRNGCRTSSSRSSAPAARNATSSTSARSICGWASANTGSSTRNRRMHALVREGDTWEETIVPESGIYHTVFLPGLQVRPAELLGPASVL